MAPDLLWVLVFIVGAVLICAAVASLVTRGRSSESQTPTTHGQLKALTKRLAEVVAEGEQIYVRAGGSKTNVTVGQIEAAGETQHLERVKALGGRLWQESLAYTAPMCKEKRITEGELRQVYANAGIFGEGTTGASNVARSIVLGQDVCSDGYYPIGHLRGMLAALQTVLG